MWVGGGVEGGAEFAGGEGVEGAEAGGELFGSELAVAEETAEEIGGVLFALLGVAFDAAGNEVAIGIDAAHGLRDDVIEASSVGSKAAHAVETEIALASMDGFAKSGGLQEVEGLEVVSEDEGTRASSGLAWRGFRG